MNPTDSDEPTTFPPAPPAGKDFRLPSNVNYNLADEKIGTFSSAVLCV